MLMTLYGLSPPSDPDGLIHHLQVPKLYIEAGRFYPIEELPFASYPMNVEALFTIGMLFGSDVLAKLVHLSMGVLLILATFTFARRYIGKPGGWIAAAILIGMPILPIWAGMAYIDMGWALYEVLGIYALLLWDERGDIRWLILAGIMAGLAMGSKYLAIGGLGVMGLWVLWRSANRDWRSVLVNGLWFGMTALLVAAPWYIKNLIWTGNPFYPYFSGGLKDVMDTRYIYTFLDYLLLPVHLYTDRLRFAGVYGSVEFPSIFFPLAILYPLTRKTRSMNGLAVMVLFRFTFWAVLSTHNRLRYLLPAFPGLAVLASAAMINLSLKNFVRKWSRIIVTGLLGGMVAGTLVYMFLFFLQLRPDKPVLGVESKDHFLERVLTDYSGLEYINNELPPDARVLMLWDLRTYYCKEKCIQDVSQRYWFQLSLPDCDVNKIASHLQKDNFSHIMISKEDLEYRLAYDPTENHSKAAQCFVEEFQPECTQVLFRDEWVSIQKLTCANE
jgi:hypothetical protein